MKITIENFGAIKHFVFDTEKDLTLIFGKNSVGKSYAISLIYLISNSFKETLLNNYGAIYDFAKSRIKSQVKKELEIFESNEYRIDLSDDLKYIINYYFSIYFLTYLNNSIINTFGDFSNLPNKLKKREREVLKIQLDYSYFSIVFCINEKSILKAQDCTLKENFIFDKNTKSDFLNTANDIEMFSIMCYDIIIALIHKSITELTPFNYYLPASRSGLYQALSAFGQIFAELSKTRNFISRKVEIPAIPEPIADYFLNLSNIDSSQNINQDFIEYINEIEEDILQGKVDFDNQTKKIYFIPDNTDLKLDLSSTSSMVSEISPIVSYLKYICSTVTKEGQKPLLFIEEPEAHLHPETQVKLMRVFARLVKDNKIKLVMTSHSNYIFNAASNLVMDNKIPADKFEAVLFKMTEEGSVAQNMATDEYGIDDDNFIDVAESLYEEKIELINKLNG